MKVSQNELFGVVAILLYIAFFSHSPPEIVESALGNAYISVALLVGLTYVTLYHNRTIGVLLIVALLLTMTHGIEHLTAKSKLKTHSVAPTTPLVNGGCPNPGTAIGLQGKSCRGPCPSGTILSGNNCLTITPPVSTVETPVATPVVKHAAKPVAHPVAHALPTSKKPHVVVVQTPTLGGVTPNISTPVGVTNTPVPLDPAQPSTALTGIIGKVTSDPTAASHLAAAAKADPVAFAPIIAKLSNTDTPKSSTSLTALPNPTGPVDKPESDKVPEPAQSCNVETFAPF